MIISTKPRPPVSNSTRNRSVATTIALTFCLSGAALPARPADAGQVDYRALAARNHGTLTSPLLRHDATARLRSGLADIDHCPDVTVRSMRVTRFDVPTVPWYERWVVADCKKTRVFDLKFTPTADGGADMEISGKR